MKLPEWRMASEDELEVVFAALYERRQWEPRFRPEYVVPYEVVASSEGLARWTIGVIHQDYPTYLMMGILCTVAMICYGFVQAWNALVRLVF